MKRSQPVRVRATLSTVARAAALLAGFGAIGQPGLAQPPDFASFRITGVDGYVGVSSQTDSATNQSPNSTGDDVTVTRARQRDVRAEVQLNLHSYIYHPKFFTLDIGLGATRATDVTESELLETRTHDTLLDYRLRGIILQDKPVHGAVFLEHTSTTPNVSADEIFTQRNRRYGFQVSAGEPVVPVGLHLEASREHNVGSSATRNLDDQVSRVLLQASKPWGDKGNTTLNVQRVGQDSASGATNLPTLVSYQDTRTYALQTKLQLDKELPFDVLNTVEVSKQRFDSSSAPTPDVEDLRVSFNLYRRHTLDWYTFGDFLFTRNRQDTLATYGDGANAGFAWNVTKEFDVSSGIHAIDGRSPYFASHSRSVDANARFVRELPVGKAQLSYATQFESHDQTASQTAIAVVGERQTLSGTTLVRLTNPRLVPGTLAVFNLTRTQQYVEGVDYLVATVGTTTRLQRLITGSILDGEEVLVDYQYDVGGTYASRTRSRTLAANWAYKSMFNAYARWADVSPNVTSGTPSTPLLSTQTRIFGLRADVPLPTAYGTIIGGLVEHERHDENIAPYVRRLREAYVSGDFPAQINANYRLGYRRSVTDSDAVAQTGDLTSYDLILGLRLDGGLNLYASALLDKDNAGLEPRETKTYALRADWRYRKITLSADVSRSIQTQGLSERDRTTARINLRRDL